MQTVLITGAASGIGRDTARLFAQSGWQCVLVDINSEALQALADSLPHSPTSPHELRAIDLTDPNQIATLGHDLPELDAILNNAGMSDTSNTPLAEQSLSQLERLLALNLKAPAAIVDACTSRLKKRARIVNVASGAGFHAIPWRGAYSPSKAGLIAQTKALAQAHPEWCVTVLAPGFVRTELLDSLIQSGRLDPANAIGKIPLGRLAIPSEIALALYFLASEGSSPISGQTLAINGGSSIYGGSYRFSPCAFTPLPIDLPIGLTIVGHNSTPWETIAPRPANQPYYPATLDVSVLESTGENLLENVHKAGARFAANHDQQASLTVLLPIPSIDSWQKAGDVAAARMLISTYACEWGAKGLRVNAIEVPHDLSASSLHELLRFVCGPQAQYLTGQTLTCRSN